jgi:hypothetical protein
MQMMTHDFTSSQNEDWQVRCAGTDRKLEHLAILLLQFLTRLSTPQFQDGDRVRWIPLSDDAKTDIGIITGRFLAYAHHCKDWRWKYLIWLQPFCNSAVTDTAWESDLELLKRRVNNESTPFEHTRTATD